jgi:hypothetical protein
VGDDATGIPNLDAAAVANKVVPGSVGKDPVVGLFRVSRTDRGDFDASETVEWVVFSSDARRIPGFGGNGDAAPEATYTWVFVSTSGEFLGSTQIGYAESPAAPPSG